MKKIICLFMLLLMVLPVISCTVGESKSDDELVREAVHLKMITAHYGLTLGGVELVSSEPTITHVEKVSDLKYKVSGTIILKDKYGTKWSNTFDCNVTRESVNDEFVAKLPMYTNDKWSRITDN